jgi:hypothetical protein
MLPRPLLDGEPNPNLPLRAHILPTENGPIAGHLISSGQKTSGADGCAPSLTLAMPRPIGTVLIVLAILLGGLWLATQWCVWQLGYKLQLGAPPLPAV